MAHIPRDTSGGSIPILAPEDLPDGGSQFELLGYLPAADLDRHQPPIRPAGGRRRR